MASLSLLNFSTCLSLCFSTVMDGRTVMMWQMVLLRKRPAVSQSSSSQLMWNGLMNTTLNFVLKTTSGTPGFQSSGSTVFTVDLKATPRRATSTTAPVAVSTGYSTNIHFFWHVFIMASNNANNIHSQNIRPHTYTHVKDIHTAGQLSFRYVFVFFFPHHSLFHSLHS